MKVAQLVRAWGKTVITELKSHSLAIVLWVTFALSACLMFKASNEPTLEALKGTWVESLLEPFSEGNQIIFDLAVGVISSLAMYVLIVWIPEETKRRRVRNNIQQHYSLFKEQCIYNLLFATEKSVDPDFVDQLADVNEFRSYFKQVGPSGSERWYDVMNNLQPHHINAIALEMGILAEEIKFTLATIDVHDEEVFGFLKRLNRTLVNLRQTAPHDEEIQYLTNFLWELFAAWSFVTGYQDRDFVADRLSRI